MKTVASIMLLVLLAITAQAQSTIKVTKVDGGSLMTDGRTTNKTKKSPLLKRSWIILNDASSPVQLKDTGLTTTFDLTDQYLFRPVGQLLASEAITAFDIRFILFDGTNHHLQTLSYEKLETIAANEPFIMKNSSSWRAVENDVSELITVVSFVAQVKTSSGKTWRYNAEALRNQLKRLGLNDDDNLFEAKPDKKS